MALEQLHPARLSYTLFSDRNPAMAWVRWAAELARANRQPVADDNAGRVAERQVSEAATRMLETYGSQRDALSERVFREIYASPVVQAMTGVAAGTAPPRTRPGTSPDHDRFVALATERLRAAMPEGGIHEALLRALIWIRLPAANADERSFTVIRRAREAVGREALPLAEFKRVFRQQFFMLLIDEARAIATLSSLLPEDPRPRDKALAILGDVVRATGEVPEEVARRLAEIERIFSGSASQAEIGSGQVRRLHPQTSGARA
jgi:hypothetical protein